MPIEYRIDPLRRLVLGRGLGKMTDSDIFGYQQELASQPDIAGYDELFDMTEVQEIALPSVSRVRDLAVLSAATDSPTSMARFAIVAPDKLSYGLGRMYQAYRELDPRSTKRVEVFHTLAEALVFLGLSADAIPWSST
jgi:hypothetical protein